MGIKIKKSRRMFFVVVFFFFIYAVVIFGYIKKIVSRLIVDHIRNSSVCD